MRTRSLHAATPCVDNHCQLDSGRYPSTHVTFGGTAEALAGRGCASQLHHLHVQSWSIRAVMVRTFRGLKRVMVMTAER